MKALYTQHSKLTSQYIDQKLNDFLIEDHADTDLTTKVTLLNKPSTATAKVVVEQKLIFVGTDIIKRIFNDADINILVSEGTKCVPGDVVATIKGESQLLLSRERVLLNLLQRLSGVATLTNQYVTQLNSSTIKILDTRKTTPGLRLFEKHAVTVGGGYNHRLDLEDGVMFKDNHLAIIANISSSLKKIKADHPGKKIQIEVDTIEQLQNLCHDNLIDVDAVLLDNMLPEQVIQCASLIRKNNNKCFIEVSGGITLDNLSDYNQTDVDGISIGAITHQSVSKNIKFEFE
tara:strand:- start:2500 stop:3366 length:867 start_codon:yes stop_codon:yes gene_type:complete